MTAVRAEEAQVRLGRELLADMRAAALRCGAGLPAVLFAAHLKVLSVVTSERCVTAGYVSEDGAARTVRAEVMPGTWRDLVALARVAADTPVPSRIGDDESVFDLSVDQPGHVSTELRVTCVIDGESALLRAMSRSDVMNTEPGLR